MFDETSHSRTLLTSKRDIFFVSVSIVGLCLSVVGFIILWRQTNPVTALTTGSSSSKLTVDSTNITVDVGGAVKKPGIYQLHAGDRLATAIEVAGGFASTADPYFISRSLNLALTVEDGEKVYIPFVNEEPSESTTSDTVTESSENTTLISINNATLEELDSLEGIGEKRAQDILAGRPYTALNELVSKKVISSSLFEKIKEFIKL